MTYTKSFPRTQPGSTYPSWEEISLTKEEERNQEKCSQDENIHLMKECITDAKKIIQELQLKEYQSDIINLAKSLFEKRASHVVYHKEQCAKEKFDRYAK